MQEAVGITEATEAWASEVQAATVVLQALVLVVVWAAGYHQQEVSVGGDQEPAIELVEPPVEQEEAPQEVHV